MENAALILCATIWRVISYSFRGGVAILSLSYGDSLLYHICLGVMLTIFCGVLILTLKISELNATGSPASPALLSVANLLDILLWVMTLNIFGVGLIDAAYL